MNFLKKLIFKAPKQEDQDNPCPLDPEFKDFEIEASVYCYDRETLQKDALYKKCTVQFDEDENNTFSYFLYLKNLQKTSEKEEDNEHFLPLNHNMEFKYFESQRKAKDYVFDYHNIEFNLDEKNTIRILIDITLEGDRIQAVLFQDYLQKLLYQSKYMESFKEASNQDKIDELIKYEEKFSLATGSAVSSITSVNTKQQNIIKEKEEQKQEIALDDLAQQIEDLQIQKSASSQSQSEQEQQSQQSQQQQKVVSKYTGPRKDDEKLGRLVTKIVTEVNDVTLCHTGSYFLIDEKNVKQMIEEGVIFILRQEQDFEFIIQIMNQEGKTIYKRPFTEEMNYNINIDQNYLKWVHFDEQIAEILLVEFDAPNVAFNVQFGIQQTEFEMKRKMKLKDCFKKQDEQQYLNQAMAQSLVNNKMEEEIVNEFKQQEPLQWSDVQESQEILPLNDQQSNQEFLNVAMDQAKLLDRTFVCKNGTLQVYRTDPEEQKKLQKIVDLPKIQDFEGHTLDPVKFQLMEQDQKMLIVNKFDTESLYQYDIGAGKVIRELKVDGYNKIKDICPDQKHSETTLNPVFNCLNAKNLFKMDPRVSQAQVADIKASEKIYTQNNHFTTLATNKNGNIAVANAQGDIRLYKQIGQNAKCLYPGFGDEIYSLDSTKDGNWILATCKNYLILLPTFSKGNQSGFMNSLKYEDRRMPVRLMLKTEDLLKYKMKNVRFTPARFNDSENGKENEIITSTGKFSIIWNLQSIAQGREEYSICEFQDDIKDIQFRFNQDNAVFAAMKDTIRYQATQKKKRKSQK